MIMYLTEIHLLAVCTYYNIFPAKNKHVYFFEADYFYKDVFVL